LVPIDKVASRQEGIAIAQLHEMNHATKSNKEIARKRRCGERMGKDFKIEKEHGKANQTGMN
jgi:hypothetical protein